MGGGPGGQVQGIRFDLRQGLGAGFGWDGKRLVHGRPPRIIRDRFWMAWKMCALTLPTEMSISRAISSYFQSFWIFSCRAWRWRLGRRGRASRSRRRDSWSRSGGHLVALHPQGQVLGTALHRVQALVGAALAGQEIQGLAGGDGDEPGAEGGLEPESGQGPVDPQEGLLHHVVGVQVVLEDGKGLAVDVPLEAFHQLAESRLVPGLGGHHPGLHFGAMVGGVARPLASINFSVKWNARKGYHLGLAGKRQEERLGHQPGRPGGPA